jgi:hypothetical protein
MDPRRPATALTALAGAAVLLLATATPAGAHTHPTPVELAMPAVVQVRTDAVVNISLVEHARGGPHIGLLQQTYRVPLMTSSGFAVDPTGSVVTTGRAVDVDLARAEVYAVNQVFQERYGERAPLPDDPYARTSIDDGGSADPLNPRLQQCYSPNTTGESGGCVVASTREVRVLPFVSDQRVYGDLPAEVVYPQEGSNDVAVLRVGASSMPTVQLASGLEGTAYAVLGFTRTPVDESSLTQVDGHFTTEGQPEVERDEAFGAQVAALRAGVQGGPVVGPGGQVLGLLHVDGGPGEAESSVTLVGPDALAAALSEAGVTPGRGPTDSVYESASHNYKNALYTAALPSLAETLKLYPGHALASEYSATSQAKAGTAEDLTGQEVSGAATTGSDDGSGSSLPVLLSIGAVLVLALVVVLLRRRRSTGPADAGAEPYGPEPPAPTTSASTTAAPEAVGTVAGAPVPAASASRTDPHTDPGSGPPTMVRPGVPRQEPVTEVRPRPRAGVAGATQPPAPGSARARASASGAAASGVLSAAGGVPPPRSAADPAATSAADAPRPVAPAVAPAGCRVCRQPTSPEIGYCESCGYPTE